MSLSCFISYNATEEERVFVYRLQTLATSSGIKVMLPHRVGKGPGRETRARIAACDLMIAFLTARQTTHVRDELKLAVALKKPVLAIQRKGSARPAVPSIHWIEYDEKRGIAATESQILEVLRDKLSKKQAQQGAVVAVLGIALLAMLMQEAD